MAIERFVANRGGAAIRKIPSIIGARALFLAASAQAADTSSVFFTPAEIAKIEAPGSAPQTLSDIHLGAILYYGANRWSIWLDGERWSPITRRADLQILDVEPEHVMLRL